MSNPRVPDGELNPQEILDPEGVDPDLTTDPDRSPAEEEEDEADKLLEPGDVDVPEVLP